MNIKMNKDIMQYKEEIYFGLTMRQCICSALAIGTSVGLFALLRNQFSTDACSMISMAGATPFALMGFFQYNKMSAERFFMAWLRHCLMPRQLPYQTETDYDALSKQYQAEEAKKKHVEVIRAKAAKILPKR